MVNITADISNLTNIPNKYLNKINEAAIYAISDALVDELKENSSAILNIGIGILAIKVEDNEIKYKFTPSKKLESSVRDTVINERNLLENRLEKTLVNRITRVYKDLL